MKSLVYANYFNECQLTQRTVSSEISSSEICFLRCYIIAFTLGVCSYIIVSRRIIHTPNVYVRYNDQQTMNWREVLKRDSRARRVKTLFFKKIVRHTRTCIKYRRWMFENWKTTSGEKLNSQNCFRAEREFRGLFNIGWSRKNWMI